MQKQKQTRPGRPAGQAADCQRKLARLVGRSPQTVTNWLRHPDWRFGGPPWDAKTVRRIIKWAALHMDRSHPEVRSARLAYLREIYRTLGLDIDIEAGRYVNAIEVDRILAKAVIDLTRGLLDIGFPTCDLIVGATVEQIREALARQCQLILILHEQKLTEVYDLAPAGPAAGRPAENAIANLPAESEEATGGASPADDRAPEAGSD